MSLTHNIAGAWRRWWSDKTAATTTTKASIIAQLRAQVNSKLASQSVRKGHVYVNLCGTVPRQELEDFAEELRRTLVDRIPQVLTSVSGDTIVVQIKWPVSESFAGVRHTTMD